jgi:hypothetical protein
MHRFCTWLCTFEDLVIKSISQLTTKGQKVSGLNPDRVTKLTRRSLAGFFILEAVRACSHKRKNKKAAFRASGMVGFE